MTKITYMLLFLCSATLFAGLKIPRKVLPIGDIQEVKEEAIKKKKPITYLITDKETSCGLCIRASEIMIDELKSKSVMTFARSKSDLPKEVQNLLKGVDTGKYIPYSIVVSNDDDKLIGIVTYQSVKADGKNAFRDIKRAIRDHES